MDSLIRPRIVPIFMARALCTEQTGWQVGYRIAPSCAYPVQRLGHPWPIMDADSQVTKTHSIGIVSQRSWIQPCECYSYESPACVTSPLGFLQGRDSSHSAGVAAFSQTIPLVEPNPIH